MITFGFFTTVLHFRYVSSFVAAVLVQTGNDMLSLPTEMDRNLQASRTPRYPVRFIAFTQRIDKSNKFSIIVECCQVKNVDFRRKFWTRKGYRESQDNDVTEMCYITSKSAFNIAFYENNVVKTDLKVFDLHFHSRRDNVLLFETDVKSKSSQISCIDVHSGDRGDSNMVDNISFLARIDIALTPYIVESVVTKVAVSKDKSRPTTEKSRLIIANGVKKDNELSALEKLQASLASALKNIDPVDFETIEADIKLPPTHEKIEEEMSVFFNIKTSSSDKGRLLALVINITLHNFISTSFV